MTFSEHLLDLWPIKLAGHVFGCHGSEEAACGHEVPGPPGDSGRMGFNDEAVNDFPYFCREEVQGIHLKKNSNSTQKDRPKEKGKFHMAGACSYFDDVPNEILQEIMGWVIAVSDDGGLYFTLAVLPKVSSRWRQVFQKLSLPSLTWNPLEFTKTPWKYCRNIFWFGIREKPNFYITNYILKRFVRLAELIAPPFPDLGELKVILHSLHDKFYTEKYAACDGVVLLGCVLDACPHMEDHLQTLKDKWPYLRLDFGWGDYLKDRDLFVLPFLLRLPDPIMKRIGELFQDFEELSDEDDEWESTSWMTNDRLNCLESLTLDPRTGATWKNCGRFLLTEEFLKNATEGMIKKLFVMVPSDWWDDEEGGLTLGKYLDVLRRSKRRRRI